MPHRSRPLSLISALAGMLILLLIGTRLIDAVFERHVTQQDPRYGMFPGTCYWAGDVRTYLRIALNGYSDYTVWLEPPHLTHLDDRSWWPLFPNAVYLVIRLGGGVCSARTVNGIAFLALIPLLAALTGERRGWRLLVLAVIPFGAWLHIGEADTFFLALSALLVWAIAHGDRHPRLAGVGALGVGVLVGLAKPNSLALVPALGVWALMLTKKHVTAERPFEESVKPLPKSLPAGGEGLENRFSLPLLAGEGPGMGAYQTTSESAEKSGEDRARFWQWVRRALGDANPGWAALLGAVGIVLGTGWWIYQTSGYYPYYVLMIQRSLWWREFDPGSVSSFAATFGTAVRLARRVTGFNMLSLQRMVELSSMIYGLALCCSQLPPRWPGGERIAIPLHWRVGVLGTFALMVASGQSHAVERYMASNVFA
ncbi:MAG TPA: hypothetical protein VMT24_05575, partial [Aggregatilineaceae bacterium]|nr:hypothetical protein [Aggregatilineaceae bacterium]